MPAATPQQVANTFVLEFFERLVKKPEDMGKFYSPVSSVTVVDFELGTEDFSDDQVASAVAKWGSKFMGCQIAIVDVRGASTGSGVNVFVELRASGKSVEHHCQVFSTLEGYTTYNAESFFIRHQVLTRIGELAVEAPPAEEPALQPEAVAAEEPEAAPAKAATPEPPQPAAAAEPEEAAEEEEAAPEEEEEAPAAPAPAPAPAATAAAPASSWADLVKHKSAAPATHAHTVRVVAAAPKKEQAAPAAPQAKPAKEPREAKEKRAIGDRLLFKTEGTVTDEEVRAALGSLAEHVVSLRNKSDTNGVVFFDFAAGVKAFDEIKKNGLNVNAANPKANVFYQKDRS